MTASDRLAEIQARAAKAADKVNQCLGDTIYACSRDHSAWGHGTMGLDDFSLAAEDPDIAESLVDETANADVPRLVAALRAVLAACDTYEKTQAIYRIEMGQREIIRVVRAEIEAALREAS